MKRILRTVAAAAVLATSANATEIVFTDLDAGGQTFTVEAGGQTVDISAATWTRDSYDSSSHTGTGSVDIYGPSLIDGGAGPNGTGYVWANQFGLQMYSSLIDGDHQIDGLGFDDLVLFEFDQLVTLTEIGFLSSTVDSFDDFVIFAGSSIDDLSMFSLLDVQDPSVALQVTGMVFGIGAFDFNDAFKITSLSFDAAVPVPGAAALLLTGLGIGRLARRKRV